MKTCPYCARESEDTIATCPECGAELPADAVSPAAKAKRSLWQFWCSPAFVVPAFISLLAVEFVWSIPARFDRLEIRGTPRFKSRVVDALGLLKAKSPDAYQAVTNYVGAIEQARHSGMAPYRTPPTFELNGRTAFYSLTWCASSIAHDSIHSKLYLDYLKEHPDMRWVPDDVWGGEAVERRCAEHQTRVLKDLGAPSREISWSSETNNRYWEVDYEKRDW